MARSIKSMVFPTIFDPFGRAHTLEAGDGLFACAWSSFHRHCMPATSPKWWSSGAEFCRLFLLVCTSLGVYFGILWFGLMCIVYLTIPIHRHSFLASDLPVIDVPWFQCIQWPASLWPQDPQPGFLEWNGSHQRPPGVEIHSGQQCKICRLAIFRWFRCICFLPQRKSFAHLNQLTSNSVSRSS